MTFSQVVPDPASRGEAATPRPRSGAALDDSPSRTVRFDLQDLEGRLLLTALPVATATPEPIPLVLFDGISSPGTSQVTQVVSQQASTATLVLSRPANWGSLQVEVTTDPSSAAVGANVGAVDQTVTFTGHQTFAVVRVPILAGAANPGEVDVTLTATPINPSTATTSSFLVLRILASAASLPPRIIAEQGTPQGIVLAFNKPMDPAAASNVHNYTVRATTTSTNTNWFLVPIDILTFPLHMDSSISTSSSSSTQTVPLRAAKYHPATNSVTLVPKGRLNFADQIYVSQGSGTKRLSRPGHPSHASLGLADVEGNPITEGSHPRKFRVLVDQGWCWS